MKKLLFTALMFCCIGILAQQDNKKPYLVVLSMDGFRWDYADSFPTPNLHYIMQNGAHAKSLVPSIPSVTFPNHYTIATGLYPDHHGIVNNIFYDPDLQITYKYNDGHSSSDGKFYDGEPIWATAQKQNMKTANYFWVGSEAEIRGIRPTYWKKYDATVTYEQRIDTVIHWLKLPESQRPHLIMFYFDNPDHLAHSLGPFGPGVREMVMHLDTLIGIFMDKLKQVPIGKQVNFMVVSDHGMEAVNDKKVVFLDQYIHKAWCQNICGHYSFITLDAKQGYSDSILPALSKAPHLKAWRKEELPKRFHYETSRRIGEFVLLADSAYTMNWTGEKIPISGNHGYDNLNTDMHAIFYTIGPAIKKGYLQASFENVNLYPLMAHILKLSPAKTDGDLELVKDMLKK
jgi:predicted AlkP superfamily pyrophosphatase or phosphodiesterase